MDEVPGPNAEPEVDGSLIKGHSLVTEFNIIRGQTNNLASFSATIASVKYLYPSHYRVHP